MWAFLLKNKLLVNLLKRCIIEIMATAEEYQERLNLRFCPSDFQAAFWSEIETGRENIVLKAVAGSGKTYSIEIAASLCVGSVGYFVFNKKNAEEAKSKLRHLKNVEVSTTYSLGNKACWWANKKNWPKNAVNEQKYTNFFKTFQKEVLEEKTLFGRSLSDYENDAIEKEGFPFSEVKSLVDLARFNLVEYENRDLLKDNLFHLADHHDLQTNPDLDEMIVSCVQRALQLGAGMKTEIDYTDMVWHPHIHKYRPKQFMTVFVDECQDLNKAQLSLMRKAVAKGGRIVAVGDPKQAIYGFAGADSEAFSRIVRETRAKVMPLSVCYRCPTSGITLAQKWCPEIQPRKNAPEGSVKTINSSKLDESINPGDLIISRTTAPLIKTCFSLIASGIGARVLGREIGKGLVKIIKICAKTHGGFDADAISRWESSEYDAITASYDKEDDRIANLIEGLRDKAECLRVVFGRSRPNSLESFENSISELFTDNSESPAVLLCTVHRAKGLESNRVFIVDFERILNPRAKRAWQLEQEYNLAYVSHTRHKVDLIYVEGAQRAHNS